MEISNLLRGNDVVRFRREGYSALVRPEQISPGQRAAATAAKRRPGGAGLIKSALLRAAQSLLLIPFCDALNRADDFNVRGPQGGASRLMPLRSALG